MENNSKESLNIQGKPKKTQNLIDFFFFLETNKPPYFLTDLNERILFIKNIPKQISRFDISFFNYLFIFLFIKKINKLKILKISLDLNQLSFPSHLKFKIFHGLPLFLIKIL